jgi:hypothetical protein
VPRDDKRPGRALGFGLPDPAAEPDDASVEDELQTIKAQLDELLLRTRETRGRDRDARADALNELGEVGVLVLQEAIKDVLKTVPLGVQVAANLPAVMDQIVQAFERRLPVAMKAAGTWSYKYRRKVSDPARAWRSGQRRRNKTDLAD